jgi:hypothetical protein
MKGADGALEISINPAIIYTADGKTTTYSFPFDYLRQAFVCVQVDNEDVSNFELSGDGRSVVFTSAPAKGSTINIYRNTTSTRLVSWADASVLKAKDLTVQQVQTLHLVEEAQYWLKTYALVLDNNLIGKGITIPWGKDQTFTWNEDGTAIVLTTNPAKVIPIVEQKVTDLETYVDKETADLEAYVDKETADLEAYVKERTDKLLELYNSLVNVSKEELLEIRDATENYANIAKAAALINSRWQITAPKDRSKSKPTYGLDDVNLVQLVVTGESAPDID